MTREITSKIIGPLQQDKQFANWWTSEEIEIPLFNHQKLTITFIDFEPEEDENFIAEADEALERFLKLRVDDRNSISTYAYKNCMDFLELVAFDAQVDALRAIEDKNEIWNYIAPIELFVSRRRWKDKDIYVQIDCECDWDQEHGLQLVYRQGLKLTRISSIDGHLTEADAYDLAEDKDELLSKF